MRGFVTTAALAGVILALAACGDKDAAETTKTEGSEASDSAGAMPAPKAGYWVNTMTASTSGSSTTTMCLDDALARQLGPSGNPAAMQEDLCSENTYTRNADGTIVFKTVCDMGTGGKQTTEGVISGDFNSAYKMTYTATIEGSAIPTANGTEQATVDAKWNATCPDGVRVGDLGLPNGISFNLYDIMPQAAADAGPAAK